MADQVEDWQSEKGFPETNLHMLESQLLTDVTFQVGEQRERIRAHKFILVSRSCVFETMFCGPLSETDSVEIPDIEANVFSSFLRYLYTSEISLDTSTVLSVLYVAKKYCVTGLEKLCLEQCHSAMSPSNACTFLQQALLFDEKDLKAKALDEIKTNMKESLSSKDFSSIGKECLDLILQEEDMCVDEIDLFKAAMSWAEEECKRQGREITPTEKRAVLGKSLYFIRFPLVSAGDLSTFVCPTNILTSDELVTLFRRYSLPDLNIEPFMAAERKSVVYNLTRSTFNVHHVTDTNRKDAIGLVPDKSVNLIGVYLYSGNLSVVHNISAVIEILDENSTKVASESTAVSVSPEMQEDKVSFAKPMPLHSNKLITLKATCIGKRRSLCYMNGLSEMSDTASGVNWKIQHRKGHSECDNSLQYGHITGICYSRCFQTATVTQS